MKITVEATPVLTTIDGVKVRLWRGTTESGLEIVAAIHRIIEENRGPSELDAELEALPPPKEIGGLRALRAAFDPRLL